MKHLTVFAIALSLSLVACKDKKESATTSTDSTNHASSTNNGGATAADSSPTTPIQGMEMCEIPEAGVKAWIENGKAYWNIYDKQLYMSATGTFEEFYRCGEGPFEITGMSETPIGLQLSKLDEQGHIALYLIGNKHHVFAYDISLEASGVGGGVGNLYGLEDIVSFKQDGFDMYALDSDQNEHQVRFYDEEGPYQFSITSGEDEYFFELTSTWNINLAINNADRYAGSFHSLGNGSFEYTLTEHYCYNDDFQKEYVNEPAITGTFRVNSNNETITFDKPVVGLPAAQALPYEVAPLFD